MEWPERPLDITRRVWLFVRVIDNYGDIGVAWRLAGLWRSALAAEVHLWCDDLAALSQLVPDAASSGIVVHHWADEASLAAQLADLPRPDWVVETFGCTLPEPVLARVRAERPLWLNWEYLTAEPWAAALHGMPSLQGGGVDKYFWFMGFDDAGGGLLREADYEACRQAFVHDAAAQAAFCRQYGLQQAPPGGQLALLFAYASPRWADWWALWQAAGRPLQIWLAGAQVADSLRASGIIPSQALRDSGTVWRQGCVCLQRIPFVPQAEFDRLLWLADWAVVRGEDSFVRAQWAALPFWWHIYPQQDAAHVAKLHAFWQQALAGPDADWQHWHQDLSDDLNAATVLSPVRRQAAWQGLWQQQADWRRSAAAWSQHLQRQPDALQRLASFSEDKLK